MAVIDLAVFNDAVYGLVDPQAVLERWDTGFTFTEGPVYHAGVYFFTDFMVNTIYCHEHGATTLVSDDSHYTLGLTYDLLHRRILGCARDARAITTLDGTPVVSAFQGVPINGGNDVVVDSKGGIYFSDPLTRKIEGPQVGHSSVFYAAPDGEVVLLEKGLAFPNGLALSRDDRVLYLTDTATSTVHCIDLYTKKRTQIACLPAAWGDGKPDGIRLDEQGNLYVAGPGGIAILDGAGNPLGLIKMPEVAANLCFDDTGLFITASRSIYHVDTRVRGAVR
jgi:gluconolactonase